MLLMVLHMFYFIEEKMDKHMRLNKDGEYEYYFSDDESESE